MEHAERMKRAMDVALGRRPADAVLRGGRIVDVHGARVVEGRVVALAGDRIAYVGPEEGDLFGPDTIIEDLDRAFLIPGLIDGHTHLDSIFTARAFAEKSIRFGNTTCVTETAMIAAALGQPGVDLFCRSAKGLPMRVYFLSPSLAPPMPEFETSAGFDERAFEEFIARPDVVGLGESCWPPVLGADPRPLARIPRARELGKSVEGHAAGAHGRKLMAYRAAGVESCHEAINIKEFRARLELGMATQIREGYIRRELEAIAPAMTPAEQASPLVQLVSDVLDPAELLDRGGLNLILKKAVGLGLDPVLAVRMMTLNPALHFNLRLLGSIVPGKLADLAVVEDLDSFECRSVWLGGQKVSQGRELMIPSEPFEYPEWAKNSFDIKKVEPKDLILKAGSPRVRARVVAVLDETITVPEEMELETKGGRVAADPGQDLALMAHLDRRGAFKPSLGLVRGTGIKEGAVAMSLIWDTCNVLVIGVNEEEMAFALNRLLELGGGLVAARSGRVEAEMPMPIGGIISPTGLEETVSLYNSAEAGVHRLGCRIKRPFLTLQVLPFTGLPFIRLTDKGLVDIRKGSMVKPIEPLG